MSQEINLLQNTRPARTALRPGSAPVMVAVVGAAAVLTGIYAGYERHRLAAVEAEATGVERMLKEARAAHEKAAAARTQRGDAGPDARVAELDAQLQGRLQVLDLLKSGAVGTTGGFAEYLLAFSRQAMEGVWLTGFDINAGGVELTLTGRALTPDRVPTYLQRLTQEPPLQGRRFASMVLAQPASRESQPGAGADADKGDPQARATPPYIEFEISSATSEQRAERTLAPAPVAPSRAIDVNAQPKKPEPAK
ncbi:MAG TPA: PilN domain-containing protein [Burkholderiales bacterium]|nr:PilN domain-containing protein [Burkholderiales bacterium]